MWSKESVPGVVIGDEDIHGVECIDVNQHLCLKERYKQRYLHHLAFTPPPILSLVVTTTHKREHNRNQTNYVQHYDYLHTYTLVGWERIIVLECYIRRIKSSYSCMYFCWYLGLKSLAQEALADRWRYLATELGLTVQFPKSSSASSLQ